MNFFNEIKERKKEKIEIPFEKKNFNFIPHFFSFFFFHVVQVEIERIILCYSNSTTGDYLLRRIREIFFPREKENGWMRLSSPPSLLTSMDVETETVGWR